MLGLAGCGGSDGDQGDDAQENLSATLHNTGANERQVHLSINGRSIVADLAGLLLEVEALRWSDAAIRDQQSPARGFALALWALLVRDRYHFDPLTAEQWGHSPVLLLNSIGFGFCDDVAAAYVGMARAAGYDARVWELNGHVVPEILVDGRWEMYDPDLEVYYLDEQGRTCGVEELAKRPDLITSPILGPTGVLPGAPQSDASATWSSSASSARYSKMVADIYRFASDNIVSSWYEEIPGLNAPASHLLLPARASLSIGMRRTSSVVGYWGSAPPAQGALQMALPASLYRRLQLPLVPVQVQGSGKVRIDDVEYEAGSESLRDRLHHFASPVSAIELVDSHEGTTVEYLLNAKRFGLRRIDEIQLEGEARGLEVAYSGDTLD